MASTDWLNPFNAAKSAVHPITGFPRPTGLDAPTSAPAAPVAPAVVPSAPLAPSVGKVSLDAASLSPQVVAGIMQGIATGGMIAAHVVGARDFTMPGAMVPNPAQVIGPALDQANAVGDFVAGPPKNEWEMAARSAGQSMVIAGGPVTSAVMSTANFTIPWVVEHWAPVDDNGMAAGGNEDTNNLKAMAWMGAATLALILAPRLVTKLKGAPSVPVPRPVFNSPGPAMGGPVANYSTLTDLARTYDDASKGITRQFERLPGVTPSAAADLQGSFHAHTRAGAARLGDSAVKYGVATTPAANFKVRTSIADLNLQDSPDVTAYLHTRDAVDKLLQAQASPNKVTAARTTVYGMDLTAALRQINQMEAANPALKQIGQEFRINTRAARDFAASGQDAIITKKQLKKLNATAPNAMNNTSLDVTHSLDGPVPTDQATAFKGTAIRDTVIARLHNGTKMQTVRAFRKADPKTFVPVTADQVAKNPQWHIVDGYERGKKRYYATSATNADLLKFDPEYYVTMAGSAAFRLKRGLEQTTTGDWAPWFSIIDAGRNYLTGKVTLPYKIAPTIPRMVASIPNQLLPQLARTISVSLDRGSAKWLRNVFGDQAIDYLSNGLAMEFHNSRFGTLEPHGAFQGSIVNQQLVARKKVSGLINDLPPGPVQQAATKYANMVVNAWKATNSAVHNMPQYSTGVRALKAGMSPEEAARTARGMAGDLSISGAYKTSKGPIRIESRDTLAAKAVLGYGRAVEIGHEYLPWMNSIMQAGKYVGNAYLKNPETFVAKTWLYAMMPEAVSYLWNASQGQDALDYMQNGRNSYQKSTSYYFKIPGRPNEDGMELPFVPQELSFFKRMMGTSMDFLFKRNVMDDATALQNAALSYLGVTVTPPMPPMVGAAFGSQGIVPPMNMFGGEAYAAPSDIDLQSQLPARLNLTIRALAGGLADIGGSFYAAASSDPGSIMDKIASGAKAAGTRVVQKTPIVRDIWNMHQPAAASNEIADALFAKQDAISTLGDYYTKYDRGGGLIDTSGASAAGTAALDKAGLGELGAVPGETKPGDNVAPVGPTPPAPTNPLYKMFMVRAYQDFLKDTINKDVPGVTRDVTGFQSLWRRHGDLTTEINSIKPVNAGNYVTWTKWIDGHPEIMGDLKKAGVDYKNPTAVRNYLTAQREQVQLVLFTIIRHVETKMSTELGRPVRLEDIGPYAQAAP